MVDVLIVEDHPVMAEALRARLGAEADLRVVASVGRSSEAVAVVATRNVDVASLGVDLGGDDGIELARRLRAVNPNVEVVFFTAVSNVDVAASALVEGARGWVDKTAPIEELLAAIRGAVVGETRIPPAMLTRVLARLQPAVPNGLATLSPRERQVLECLVDGLDGPSTAARLHLSRNTVRTHIQHVLQKLDVHSVTAAVAVARGVATRPG